MENHWMERYKIFAPPWMIIGISLLLMAVVVFVGLMNYNREKTAMGDILNQTGAALIRSFEAGARTGMMGMLGNEARLQTLIEETASQPGIIYIALADSSGMILAHSRAGRVGTIDPSLVFNTAFSPGDEPMWRMQPSPDRGRIFEVYKRFVPMVHGHDARMGNGRGRGHRRPGMSCPSGWMDPAQADRMLSDEHRPAIIIGMDVTPFEEAMAEDLITSALILVLIFFLAFSGVVTLFWAQHVMRSRKLLQDTRAFASEIVSHLPVGIVVVGTEGAVRYINTAACSLLGVRPEFGAGRSAGEILPPEILDLRDRIVSRDALIEKEMTLGEGVPVSVNVTDVVGEDGLQIGYMVVMTDVSDLRRLEGELRRREKLSAMGNLAAGIAHEVRNPLSSIKGYASYLGSLFDAGSDNRKAADIMVEEVDRVNRVISELLEFARPSDLKWEKTDVAGLIGHCLDIIAPEAEFAGVTVASRVDPDLPPVDVDPDRITQVLLNVLINAVQAMDRGGWVSVSARGREQDWVLEVEDTGRGIAPKDLPHVFNPYFTGKKNGTGLGLAIVHKIVESHGGSVQIQSRIDQGTTVSICLPRYAKKDSP